MSSDNTDVKSANTGREPGSLDQAAFAVAGGRLVNYWNERAPGSRCLFCRKGDYSLAASPVGDGSAAVVATPVPNMDRLGMWFYVATCNQCGHVMFFNSQFVLRHIGKDT